MDTDLSAGCRFEDFVALPSELGATSKGLALLPESVNCGSY
jgi:hypothetical protein